MLPEIRSGKLFSPGFETFSHGPCTLGHEDLESKSGGTVSVTTGSLAEATAEQGVVLVGLEERSWLARHCRGEAAAFPALMAAYRRPVYSYLVRSGIAEADRDDLFQSIFLAIHRAADRYEATRPLAPWIFTIVANLVRNHFRDRRPDEATDFEPPETADPTPDPERVAAARQAVARLEVAMLALPLAQREVLLLTAVAGLKLQEAADALSLPLNTIKTQLRRARLALAKALAKTDGDTDGAPFETPLTTEDKTDDQL